MKTARTQLPAIGLILLLCAGCVTSAPPKPREKPQDEGSRALELVLRVDAPAERQPITTANQGVYGNLVPVRQNRTGGRVIMDANTVVWVDGPSVDGQNCGAVNAKFGTNFTHCVALRLDANGVANKGEQSFQYYMVQSAQGLLLRENARDETHGSTDLFVRK